MRHKFHILLLIGIAFCQEYTWPTSTGQQLTSNFGEFRNDHFHMGLDIRTNQSVGHPLYAVADGYIYRISTNFKGYGKALYLKTTDNKNVLYGHLTKYSDDLENHLYDLQEDNQSYYVDQYFTKHEYPVSQGDIIGYSGNSGGSMGPHLHFEIRNEKNQPLNPLTYGFPVKDSAPPIFLELAILPINEKSLINGSALPKTFILDQISKNKFTLSDEVIVDGPIALALRIIDKIPYAIFTYQFKQVEMLVDSVSVFSVKYDSLDFEQDNFVRTVHGQPVTHNENDDFQKLYRSHGYPQLLIHPNNDDGIIELSEGLHKFEIIAKDASQNESILSFYVESMSNVERNNGYLDRESLSLNSFKTDLIVLETGFIFNLQTNHFQNDSLAAFIEKPDTLLTFPLTNQGGTFSSRLINNDNFDNSKNSGFVFYSDTVSQYNFVNNPTLVGQNSDCVIFSRDSVVTIEITDAFFDTTLIWVSDVSSQFYKYRKHRISNVYNVQPYGIPYKNDLVVNFKIEDKSNYKQNAIYRFDKKKFKWKYVKSIADSNGVSAKIPEPEILTVFKDNQLPWIESTEPYAGQICPRDSLQGFNIIVDDNLSGIDYSEEKLQVFLDEKRLWVAYQPFEQEISYAFRDALSLGEHNLRINIQDRSGNSISKSIKFFVE